MQAKKRWLDHGKTLLTWGILLGVLAGGWAWLHGSGSHEAKPTRSKEAKVVPVTVEAVVTRPEQQAVNVVGSLHGFEEIALNLKVDGRVLRIHKDVGDVIQPGDVLLELDPRDYELATREARAALEVELTRLAPGLKTVPGKEFDLSSVAIMREAAAQEKKARLDFERAVRLGTAIAGEGRDAAERDLQVALAKSKQAHVEVESILAAARYKQSVLDTALWRLEESKLVLPKHLKSPSARLVSAGELSPDDEFVVCHRSVSEGEMVRVGPGGSSVLFKVMKVRPLKLKANVPERFLGQVKVGQKTKVKVEAFPGEAFPGEVARVNPSVNPSSRTFEVEVHVPNAERRLSPGSFVKVAVLTRVDPKAAMVPEEAVVRFAGVTKVFVLEGERVREVQVKTGATQEETSSGRRRLLVEVSGLTPGARVVTSGQTQLADGTLVRLRE